MTTIRIDKIIRSKRRSIGLTITPDARLIVRAPHWTPTHEIERLISRKHIWIKQKQEIFLSRPKIIKRQNVEGEKFLFFGQEYALKFVDDLPKAGIKFSFVCFQNCFKEYQGPYSNLVPE